MKDFIDYTFYETDSYKNISMNSIYILYKMYCKLFNHEPLSKFKFIEEFNDYVTQRE